jgi:hypothetical protein
MRLKILMAFIVALLLGAGFVTVEAKSVAKDTTSTISSSIEGLQTLPGATNSIKLPEIKNPDWLQSELDAEAAAKLAAENAAALAAEQQLTRVSNRSNQTVTYDVSTRGTITADLSEFKSLANQTLNDGRGWSRLGVSFQEVASGGSFNLVLSEASQVPSFYPSICSIYWSCTVGNYVIINQDRWLYASDSWNMAGGALRDYRDMVINHETGHWLGHGDDNYHCGGAGHLAPVMQQQSIDLMGCSFNPWPLNSELWSSRLGI